MNPHSNDWYDRLAKINKEYSYPWKSEILDFNGEDTFLQVLKEYATTKMIALDVGCGHGELTLQNAGYFKEVYAYDRVKEFIDTANNIKQEKKIKNVHFICGNAKKENQKIKIPFDDIKFDVIYSRRGPLHYIADVERISKNGTFIIQLNPASRKKPDWLYLLPKDINKYDYSEDEFSIKKSVEQRLSQIDQKIHRYWFFDVPEYFNSKQELYNYLFWYDLDKPPYSFDELSGTFDKIFEEYSVAGKLEIRHRRFLWTSYIKIR